MFFRIVLSIYTLWLCLVIGCTFCADLPALSPQDLYHDNDYIFVGRLINIDTLYSIGQIPVFGKNKTVNILEYKFIIKENIKGTIQKSTAYLWYYSYNNSDNSYEDTVRIALGHTTLIYGNMINSLNNILNVSQTEMNCDIYDWDSIANNELYDSVKYKDQGYKNIMQILSNAAELKRAFTGRNEKNELILYGTDPNYYTNYSYSFGRISYCDNEGWIPTDLTSEEYLDELRILSESTR